MPYTLLLKKQDFKFSSSHFTIFSKTEAEFLHGHNYQVGLKVQFKNVDAKTEMAVDFNAIKKAVRALCNELDEKILLPRNSTFLKITDSPHYPQHTEVRFLDRIYCFPKKEIYFIEASNVTSESLARYLHQKLSSSLPAASFSVTVFETAGQAASYTP